MRGEESRERLQPELEPVRLVLVAAEEEDGAAFRRAARRREVVDVDGVVEDLPRPGRRSDPLVGRALAELALVEDVHGLGEDPPKRSVERLGAAPRPTRVAHAVLVDEERDAAPACKPEKRAEVSRQPRRPQVEEREVRRVVGKARHEPLKLRRSARDGLARLGHAIVAVEDSDARVRPTGREQPRPARPGARVPADPVWQRHHRGVAPAQISPQRTRSSGTSRPASPSSLRNESSSYSVSWSGSQ